MKKINFKEPKYMIPAIIYLPLAFIGYMVIDMFNLDVSGPGNSKLKTTDYLSSELPEAYTDSILGDKMTNTEKEFGKVTDLSGVQNVESDRDSVAKKQDYDSKYNEEEAQKIREQQAEEKRKLQEMQNRVRESKSNREGDDFVASVSDSDIERAQRRRRQRNWEEMNRNLSGSGGSYTTDGASSPTLSSSPDGSGTLSGSTPGTTNNYAQGATGGVSSSPYIGNNGYPNRSTDDEEPEKVTKKTKEMSDYFNTVGADNNKEKLITAIIDENVKAVDGSRVRLRLLDDIEIGGETIKKGTYLYATMSGFGKQRVNGKVESIFYDEEIIKVSLSIYDTDGIEGLYVPQSSFRETTQDVASSAMQGGNILDNTTSTSSGGIASWASQAAQNASQKVMQAIGKASKKNRVRLKYGTKVYLVDGSQKEKSNRNRNKY